MNNLKELIASITQFGSNPNVEITDKEVFLKKRLVEVYLAFLNSNPEQDDNDYPVAPHFEFKEILKNVKSNFPNFGWYSSVIDSNKIAPNTLAAVGV